MRRQNARQRFGLRRPFAAFHSGTLLASIDQDHRGGAFNGLDWVGRLLALGRDRIEALDAVA